MAWCSFNMSLGNRKLVLQRWEDQETTKLTLFGLLFGCATDAING